MLIKSLELNNFLSHRETVMFFDRGVNMIVGPNGAGKTSILDGIRFAMFGKDRARLSNPVLHGATACSVKLSFQVDEDSYEITRSFGARQKDREALLTKNGIEIASSQDSVTSYIEKEIIEMDQDVFENSVFVEQGEIDDLVNEQPKKRKEFFSKMLGIEKLSNTASLLGEISADVGKKIAEAQGKLERLSIFREELQKAQGDKKRFSSELEAAAGSISQLVLEEKSLKEELERRKENDAILRGKVSLLSSKKKELENLVNEINSNLKKLEKYQAAKEEATQIGENPLYRYHGDILEAASAISRLTDLKKRQEEHESARRSLDELRKQLSNLQPDHDLYSRCSSEHSEITKSLKTLEKNDEAWRKVSDRISVITEDIASLDSRITALSPELEKLFGSGTIDSAVITARINKLESEIEELGKRITIRKSDLGSRNERKRELTSRIDQLEGKSVCPLCGSTLSAEHINRLQSEIDESVQATLAEIGTIAGDIARLTADQEKMKEVLSQMRSRGVSDMQQAMDAIRSRREALAALQKDEELLRNFHEEFAEKRRKAYDLEKRIESLQSMESGYSGIKARLEAAETTFSGKDAEEIGSRMDALRQEIDRVETMIGFPVDSRKVDESTALYRRYLSLEPEFKEAGKLSLSLEEKRARSGNLEGEISGLQADLSGLETSASLLKKLESDLDVVTGKHAELSGIVSSRRESIARLDSEIRDLNSSIVDLEATEKSVHAMKNSIETINRLRAAFGVDGIQKYLRQKASEFITNGTRQILSSFSLDFDDVLVNEDFDVSIQKNGLLELESLSGGERIALSIALRISISRFLDREQRMNCFLMDEPTTFLDEERRANLRNILHYALGEESYMPQLILITHHSELISAGDVIFEVSKESGVSRVSA